MSETFISSYDKQVGVYRKPHGQNGEMLTLLPSSDEVSILVKKGGTANICADLISQFDFSELQIFMNRLMFTHYDANRMSDFIGLAEDSLGEYQCVNALNND